VLSSWADATPVASPTLSDLRQMCLSLERAQAVPQQVGTQIGRALLTPAVTRPLAEAMSQLLTDSEVSQQLEGCPTGAVLKGMNRRSPRRTS
jgi:hypothetical protein